MGKQRPPQGRPGRHDRSAGTPPVSEARAMTMAGPVTDPEPMREEAALRAHLMDSVSSKAIGGGPVEAEGFPSPLSAAAPVDVPGHAPVPADALVSAAMDRPDMAPADMAASDMAASEPVSEPEPRAVAVAPPLSADAPAPPLDPESPLASGSPMPAPSSWRAGISPRREPIPRAIAGMGETLFAFLRGESTAVVSHLQALGAARSPADAIRLQVTEIQRAADASLTCWSSLARRASRIVARR